MFQTTRLCVVCSIRNITNGNPSMFGSLNINDTVTYNCADGYELQGAENLTCQMDGLLSAQPPDCVQGRKINPILGNKS